MKVLSEVDAKIKKLKQPTGEEDAPSRSCHDFKVHNPDKVKKNMKIWIDPNMGDPNDKIIVYCEFRSKVDWTCIPQVNNTFATRKWVDQPLKKHTWFSDILPIQEGRDNIDNEFAYAATRSQINALSGVSDTARQDMLFNCKNTVAYYDASTQQYDKSVRLRAYNERILTAGDGRRKKGQLKFRVDENDDKCMYPNSDGSTKIEIRTKNMGMLPIIDAAVRDAGDSDQQFGFTVEPVCFGTTQE